MTQSTPSERLPLTIVDPVSFELLVKRSRFIAFLEPVSTKEQAQDVLDRHRREYWDAVHHCYAWRIGSLGLQYRMSDDGEPSGTAGKPMLFALQQANLCNVVTVVVRYFGGIKLGIGPLARAYADTVKGAISKSTTKLIVLEKHLLIHCPYDDVSRIIPLLEEAGAAFEMTYSDAVTFEVVTPHTMEQYIKDEVIRRTNARAGFSKVTTD